jgi:hypothetical protein
MHAAACARTLSRQVPGSAAAAAAGYGGSSGGSSSSDRWGFEDVLAAVQETEAILCPLCGR